MRIKVERSGGLAGIFISNEIDSQDLPSELIGTAKKIIEDDRMSTLSMKSSINNTADQYNYKISIQDGVNQKVVEFNEYNINEELKSLIKYIERNSKKRIKSQFKLP